MWNFMTFYKYALCSQEKNCVYLMWDKKTFDLNTLT